MRKTRIAVGGVALTIALAVTGCTAAGGGAENAATGLVIGTTDTVVSLDPAGAYDTGSYTVIYNIYERLMEIPEGETEPVPSLAESCEFTAATTYTCTLPEGTVFTNGDELTASDVVFSIQRVTEIADPSGPVSMFGSLASVSAPDDVTVIFELALADQTFPYVLANPAASIVDEDVFAADAILDSPSVVGSGPFALQDFAPGEQVVLTRNADYSGAAPAKSDTIVVQSFTTSSALKLAVEDATVDVAYRSLDPADLEALRENQDVATVLEGAGLDTRYIGFNLSLPPSEELAVRRAIAYSIDRQAILDNVYDGRGTPLYSMINAGFGGATEAYADEYGSTPDLSAAEAELTAAGITAPVELELWWTPTHYGTLSGDEYTEIKRQLEETGLFTVTLESTEWQQYIGAALGDQYAMYQLGGSADYPSSLVFLHGFYVDGGFLNNHFSDADINAMAEQALIEPDAAVRDELLGQVQAIYAAQAPTIPLSQGLRTAVVGPGVTGVEETLDLSGMFRMSNINK